MARRAALFFAGMKVSQIMTAHAQCVAPDNTLVEAAGLMRELDVGALPVCEGDRLAGMVTDRDIVLRGVADGRDANTATVREVMSSGIIHVFSDQEVEDVARVMEEKQIRRVAVVNRSKRLVGIVSLGDLAVNSNPAFSGIALKEVSQTPAQRMRDHAPRMIVRAALSRVGAGDRGDGTRRNRAGATKKRATAKRVRKPVARGGKRATR
jgi:CBS domain-containing protein